MDHVSGQLKHWCHMRCRSRGRLSGIAGTWIACRASPIWTEFMSSKGNVWVNIYRIVQGQDRTSADLCIRISMHCVALQHLQHKDQLQASTLHYGQGIILLGASMLCNVDCMLTESLVCPAAQIHWHSKQRYSRAEGNLCCVEHSLPDIVSAIR